MYCVQNWSTCNCHQVKFICWNQIYSDSKSTQTFIYILFKFSVLNVQNRWKFELYIQNRAFFKIFRPKYVFWHVKPLFGPLKQYFKGFYMPKNTFFENTKKFLCKIFWDFCTCTKVACAKKHWSRFSSRILIKLFFWYFLTFCWRI